MGKTVELLRLTLVLLLHHKKMAVTSSTINTKAVKSNCLGADVFAAEWSQLSAGNRSTFTWSFHSPSFEFEESQRSRLARNSLILLNWGLEAFSIRNWASFAFRFSSSRRLGSLHMSRWRWTWHAKIIINECKRFPEQTDEEYVTYICFIKYILGNILICWLYVLLIPYRA
jgi:hypothetical protein